MRVGLALAAMAVVSCFWAVAIVDETTAQVPTFARDVAPIVYRRCASCHHDGGSGPFPLVTYRDVQKRSRQIRIVIEDRYMPPWPPAVGYGEFVDSRRLDDVEYETMLAWIDGGAPLGDAEQLAPPPAFEGDWKLGTPDKILRMERTYEVPAEGFDVWRTFVIPTGLDETTYLRAIEFRPGNERAVHHFIMYMDATDASRRRDAEDPGVGFPGMTAEITLLGEEAYGWIPGMSPRALPEETATIVAPGTDFVLDTHFVPTGRVEKIRMEVGLYFADGPPKSLVSGVVMIGPGASIPPGQSSYTIEQSFVLPVDVRAMNIAPHAHYVCHKLSVWATLPNGTRKDLLRIDDWDPNWQEIYQYDELERIPKGTTLSMRFTYDNSENNERNPFSPPHRVISGKASFNEMAVTWLNVLVDTPDDLEALKRASEVKYRDSIDRANKLLDIWKSLVMTFDLDGDGTLDIEEDERATEYVNGIFDNVPHLMAGFDANKDGLLDGDERAFVERVVRYWNGEPAR